MKNRILGTALAVACWTAAEATPITWVAIDPSNDMEDSGNWDPTTVPGSGNEAIFDSSILNIAFNPTESTNPFSVLDFNFLHNANPFVFFFNNQTLTFYGDGIIGNRTDTEIDINNINNSTNLSNLISFLAAASTSGSSEIFVENNASLSGLVSNTSIGIVDSLFHASGDFILGFEGFIDARNIANDSANNTGNNTVGSTNLSQMRLDGSTFAGNDSGIFISNNGTYSGVNTVLKDTVAAIGGSQLLAAGTFETGSDFFLDVRNEGTDQGFGVGSDLIGVVSGQQAFFQNDLNIGNGCGLSIQNRGTSSSTKATGASVGRVNGNQLLVQGNFLAEDDLSIFIQNAANDTTGGAGGDAIGYVGGSQIHLDSGATIGDSASIFMLNTGSRTRTTVSASSSVGIIGGLQFNSASNFLAGDGFILQAINGGDGSGTGQFNQNIGIVNGAQVEFGTTCTLGDGAVFNIVNTGFNFDSTSTFNSIAVIQGCQFKAKGDFTAGENLVLLARNQGINFGDATNDVGLVNDSQVSFEQACNLNDGSIIQATNLAAVTNCQIEFLNGFNVLSGKAFIQSINNGTFGCFGVEILGNNAGGNAEIILSNSSLSIDTTLPTFTIGGLSGDSLSFAESSPTLIINTDSSTFADFEGTIQDFPAETTVVVKTGPGTQVLSGVNTYTGLTTVEGGDLILNGSVAATVFVDTFGTLRGIGTIGGNLINSGTVSPGQSIGTMTILGNYINNSDGIYDVEVNGNGDSDLLSVVGQAILNGGTVVVSTEDSFQFHQPYLIVETEGGVVGTYEGATSTAFIDPTLSYDLFNVYLTIDSDLSRAARTCNQIGVATILDAIPNLNASQDLLINAIANMTLNEAQAALESLSGFQYTHDIWMTDIGLRRFLRNIYNPIRTTACQEDCKAWLEVSESTTHLSGKNAHKAHAKGHQISGGIQRTICSNLTLGLAGSYEEDRLSFRHGNAHRDTKYIAAYGLFDASPYYGLFDLVFGHTTSKYKRSIQINDIRDQFHSKPLTDLFAFYGEVGFDYYCNCLLVQPFIGIQASKNWRYQFHENRSSDFNLSINEHQWSSTSSRLGIHAATDYNCVVVSADLAWNKLLSCHKNRTKGRFTDFGDTFSICGNDISESSIDYALTLSTCISECLKGYVEVAGETWSHASTYEVLGGIEYTW